MASVALRLMPSQDTWPMATAIPVLMVMVSMLMVLVLPDIPVPPPLSLPDLPRDLASVVLNPVMDFMVMEYLLVFLTMELFMESTSFTQLDTPSNMLPAASVVLMLKLMLTMVVMDMVIMDMLTMDMLTLDR